MKITNTYRGPLFNQPTGEEIKLKQFNIDHTSGKKDHKENVDLNKPKDD